MIKNLKSKLEIAGILVVALTLSIFSARLFFVNNTPQLNPAGASSLTSTVLSWIKDLAPRNTATNKPGGDKAAVFSQLEQVAFSPVAKGVSAREANGVSEIRYEDNKVTWVEYTYTTKEGKTLRLKVPAGQDAPPQSLIDLLY